MTGNHAEKALQYVANGLKMNRTHPNYENQHSRLQLFSTASPWPEEAFLPELCGLFYSDVTGRDVMASVGLELELS